jgi:hypothetical protein
MLDQHNPDKWNMPPKAKVYEALSAVADGRVTLSAPTKALVASSSGDKNYVVEWSDDLKQIVSNDNASYWQGYMGYPIIAVLLFLGKIPFEKAIARKLAGIPWNDLNKQYRHDYDKAVAATLHAIREGGGDSDEIVRMVDRIYEGLRQLDLHKLGRRRRPTL